MLAICTISYRLSAPDASAGFNVVLTPAKYATWRRTERNRVVVTHIVPNVSITVAITPK